MVRATYNDTEININKADDITMPVVKLGDRKDIPTIPFLWHREECFSIPILSIIKIKNKEMENIFKNFVDKKVVDQAIFPFEECYIVTQTTVLEKSNYYISYHGFMYRQDNNIENEDEIPSSYNVNRQYTTLLCPMSNGFIEKTKMNIPTNGSVFVHGKAFSPAYSIFFSIDEKHKVYKLFTHGVDPKTNKSVSVIFILINDHTEIYKPINEDKTNIDTFSSSLVKNAINRAIFDIKNDPIRIHKQCYEELLCCK